MLTLLFNQRVPVAYSSSPADSLTTTDTTTRTAVTSRAIAEQTLQISCGGPVAGSYLADVYFSSTGTPSSTTNPIDVSLVANAAPQSVYQNQRYGSPIVRYIIPGLNSGTTYTVRLAFVETYFGSGGGGGGVGSRTFSISINGTVVVSSFDIYQSVGSVSFKAITQSFSATPVSGSITILLTSITNNACVSGVEVFPTVLTTDAISATQVSGPVNLARTPSDTEATNDSILRLTAASRLPADISTFSDTKTQLQSVSRLLADTATTADGTVRTAAFSRAPGETDLTSDGIARVQGVNRPASDSSSFSDSTTRLRAVSLTTADTESTSDAVARLEGLGRSTADTNATLDATATIKQVFRAPTDADPTSDVVLRLEAASRYAADSIGMTDGTTRIRNVGLATSASLPMTDNAARLRSVSLYSADFIVVSDAIGRTGSLARSTADTALTSDSTLCVAAVGRSAINTNAMSDSASGVKNGGVQSLSRTQSDSSSFTDAQSTLKAIQRPKSDTLSTVDSLARTGAYARPNADSLTTSDAIVRSEAISRLPSDAALVTDVIARYEALFRTSADTLSLSDLLAGGQARTRSTTDTSHFTDQVSRTAASSASTTPTIVQKTTKAYSNSNGGNVSFTFSSAPTPGNTVVLVLNVGGGLGGPIVPSGFTLIDWLNSGSGSNNAILGCWRTVPPSGDTGTYIFASGVSINYDVFGYELSGANTASGLTSVLTTSSGATCVSSTIAHGAGDLGLQFANASYAAATITPGGTGWVDDFDISAGIYAEACHQSAGYATAGFGGSSFNIASDTSTVSLYVVVPAGVSAAAGQAVSSYPGDILSFADMVLLSKGHASPSATLSDTFTFSDSAAGTTSSYMPTSPTIVQSSSQGFTTTSGSNAFVALGSTPTPGNVVLLVLCSQYGLASSNVPAGFTQLGSANSGSSNGILGCWRTVPGSGDTGTYSFASTSSMNYAAFAYELGGVNAAVIAAAFGTNIDSGSYTASASTIAHQIGDLGFAFACTNHGAQLSPQAGVGWHDDLDVNFAGSQLSAEACYQTAPYASSASGGASFNVGYGGNASGCAVMFVVMPAVAVSGQNTNATPSDTFGTVDALTGTKSITRPWNELIHTLDAVLDSHGTARVTSDTFTTSDARTSVTIHNLSKSLADTLSFSDAAARTAARQGAPSDALSTTDALVRTTAMQRTKSDTLPTNDVLSGGKVTLRSVNDSTSFSDIVVKPATTQRTTAESLAFTDAAVPLQSVGRQLTETFSTIDAGSALKVTLRATADIFSFSDGVTRQSGDLRTNNDSFTTVDSAVRAYGPARFAAETFTTGDMRVSGMVTLRTSAENLPLIDAAGRSVSTARSSSDAFITTDAILKAFTLRRANLDVLPLTDALTRSGVLLVQRSIAESAAYVNCGGAAIGAWTGDAYNAGGFGTPYSTATAVDTSAVPHPAPQAVYQSLSYQGLGNSTPLTFVVPGFVAGGSYVVRVHLAEIIVGQGGQRTQNIYVNGVGIFGGDVNTAAGGNFKAIVRSTVAVADGSGNITVEADPVYNGSYWTTPAINGIEIVKQTVLTDSVAAGIPVRGRSLSDSFPTSDSTVQQKTFVRSYADTLSLADLIGRNQARVRLASDTFSMIDAALPTKLLGRLAADAVFTIDGISEIAGHLRAPNDTGTTTDTTGGNLARVRLTSDPFSTIDAAVRTELFARLAMDAAPMVDGISAIAAHLRALADTETTTDAIGKQRNVPATLSDTLPTGDAAIRKEQLSRVATDANSTTDSAGGNFHAISRNTNDSVPTTDGISSNRVNIRILADVNATFDSIVKLATAARFPADTSTFTDAITQVKASLRSLADSSSLTDSVVRRETLARVLGDALVTVDSIAAHRTAFRAASDAFTVVAVVLSYTLLAVPVLRINLPLSQVIALPLPLSPVESIAGAAFVTQVQIPTDLSVQVIPGLVLSEALTILGLQVKS